MANIKWDETGSRTYEGGIDHGVLYLTNGRAIPWNGLVNITESANRSTTPIYFDGRKILDLVELGNYQAKLEAITYPDEVLALEGLGKMINGVYVGDQAPKIFHMSYRTRVGNDVEGPEAHYQIHILYNITAIPADKQYQTFSNESDPMMFEWDLTAVPEEVPGFRPTAHIILDSRFVDDTLMENVELLLYGGTTANPAFPPFQDLMSMITSFVNVEITDNGNGTWTAFSLEPGYIIMVTPTEYTVESLVVYSDDGESFEISSQ